MVKLRISSCWVRQVKNTINHASLLAAVHKRKKKKKTQKHTKKKGLGGPG